jgi:hypothetical protein
MKRFRYEYGARPLHLVGIVLSLAIAAYAAYMLFQRPDRIQIGIWFLGAILLHDLVFLPLYSAIDRLPARTARRRPTPLLALNHVRIPVAISGLLFILFIPLILKTGEATYTQTSGQTPDAYLERWLGITAVLFMVSALLFVARRLRAGRSGAAGSPASPAEPASPAAANGRAAGVTKGGEPLPNGTPRRAQE